MAIYHLHMQIISRGSGKSAVAAASYRSGDALTNEYDGTPFDYSRKGGIIHSEILLPTNAPREFSDRSTLWNAVEKIEKASNAQLAREIEIALPVELTTEQNIILARQYVQQTYVDNGMAADVCWHAPDKETPNPHAHIMLTMRPFNEDGSWDAKQRKSTFSMATETRFTTRRSGSTLVAPCRQPIGTNTPTPRSGERCGLTR
jgi:ATP-dependent exoDNAse (exonuclease V) alpha subunit